MKGLILPSGRVIALPDHGYRLQLAAVAAAYVASGKFGISLSVAHGVITPVWAPSGISLAALLIFGRRLWPAVAVGAFVVNATSGVGLLAAAAIAAGNTLEGVTGAYLLERVGFRIHLERVRDVLVLVVMGAGLSTLISATTGVAALWWVAGAPRGSFGSEWLLWWFGDAIGVLLVTPLLLLLYVHRRARATRLEVLEGAFLLWSLSAVSAIVFLAGGWRYQYLIFPLLLWAVLRFRQVGAATASFLVGVLATWGTVTGTVPISAAHLTARVQVIQALVSVVAMGLLLVGAMLAERESAIRELRKTAARLREAEALTHIGSWEWGLTTDAVTLSDELHRIFGLPPEQEAITSAAFLAQVHPDDRGLVEERFKRAYADREPFSLEHRIVVDGDTRRLVEVRGRVILGESGEPVRMVGTAQDITDQRQAETLREDILSTVSHELRTPLASVLNFSLILRDTRRDLEEQDAAILEHIIRLARRLDRLLSDLLEVDRIQHGRAVPLREPTDVTQLVWQVAAIHQTKDRSITMSTEPTIANVDRAKVERIVDNLLGNAVRHTPRGTPIALRLERQGDDLLIIVDDGGPGIPDEYKSAVFEIFDRGAKVMSNEPGAGIGLSLVARFAALHGGRTWVEDSAGGGASVRVLLPDCVLSDVSERAGSPSLVAR